MSDASSTAIILHSSEVAAPHVFLCRRTTLLLPNAARRSLKCTLLVHFSSQICHIACSSPLMSVYTLLMRDFPTEVHRKYLTIATINGNMVHSDKLVKKNKTD